MAARRCIRKYRDKYQYAKASAEIKYIKALGVVLRVTKARRNALALPGVSK